MRNHGATKSIDNLHCTHTALWQSKALYWKLHQPNNARENKTCLNFLRTAVTSRRRDTFHLVAATTLQQRLRVRKSRRFCSADCLRGAAICTELCKFLLHMHGLALWAGRELIFTQRSSRFGLFTYDSCGFRCSRESWFACHAVCYL